MNQLRDAMFFLVSLALIGQFADALIGDKSALCLDEVESELRKQEIPEEIKRVADKFSQIENVWSQLLAGKGSLESILGTKDGKRHESA